MDGRGTGAIRGRQRKTGNVQVAVAVNVHVEVHVCDYVPVNGRPATYASAKHFAQPFAKTQQDLTYRQT